MKLLTKDMQADVARQMINKARDIDMALYNYLDGSMDHDFVLDALTFFMNKDGIGNALYIDNYNPNTSSYQIYEALRILDMADFDSNCNHELFDLIINKCFNYIYNRCEIKDNMFNPNVITNNDFAHSCDFTYNEENRLMFGYAPTAAILGYTLVFCKPTKAYYKKALKMIPIMLNDLYKKESLSKYEFISFNSFLNSIKKVNLFTDEQPKIEEKLVSLALKQASCDFSDLTKIRPLDVALYLNDSRLDEMKNKHLDYIIDTRAFHGLWDYEGGWGYNTYAEEDTAKMKWVGALAVNYYYILKKYGRIE